MNLFKITELVIFTFFKNSVVACMLMDWGLKVKDLYFPSEMIQ